jgi:hypothetical protein
MTEPFFTEAFGAIGSLVVLSAHGYLVHGERGQAASLL